MKLSLGQTVLLSLLISVPVSQQLDATVEDGAVFHACAADDLELSWNVTLEAGEVMREVHWYYETEGQSREMIAMLTEKNSFLTMPSYSQRLKYVPFAGIHIDYVTATDTGNYSVEVKIQNATNHEVALYLTANLEMMEEPVTVTGSLTVEQKPDLEFNNSSKTWHVVLMCGRFAYLGNPPVNILWMTPAGQILPSSSYDNGYFNLHLPNPVQDGNYTCHITPDSPALQCLRNDSALLHGVASYEVNGLESRVRITEARQTTLETENKRLREELENKTSALQNQIDGIVEDINSQNVSFHALLAQDTDLHDHEVLIPTAVTNNVGDGYNSSTGLFTAPVAGTYFFAVSVASPSDRDAAGLQMVVSGGGGLACWVHTRSGTFESGSCHAAIQLNEGDTVWLRSNGDAKFAGIYTAFSGFLVHAG